MESDSFASHHPHTLGDYFSRAIVLVVFRLARMIFRDRYAQHALVLEAVLASMLTAIAAHAQYAALRNFRADREHIEELLGEASTEHLHVLVLKRVTTVEWYGKAAIWKMQFIYIPLFRLIYCLAPSFAHRLVAYTEERLAGIYADWLLHLLGGALENMPAPVVAIKYWELPEEATLIELLNVLIADTAKHRDRNHRIADK